jgi:aminomethyltransferase
MNLKMTPLHAAHERAGARLVDFAGWEMPLHYGSQLEEHKTVRVASGMFDVSHMRVVDVHGPDARPFLRALLANDVAKLQSPGRALYSCMLNAAGGVLDDLIVYFRGEADYRLVVNAATAEGDVAHMRTLAATRAVTIAPRPDLALIAVQGPEAVARTLPVLPENLRAAAELKPFHAVWDDAWTVARTGYTGEDGFEIMLPVEQAEGFWEGLRSAGVRPAGLGARDTLRLEAGMNLYGTDMDATTTPLVSNLGWTVAWEPHDRDFVGRAALERQRAAGVPEKLVGLVLHERGVLRDGTRIQTAVGEGIVTSGSFSPTLGVSIALARIPSASTEEVLMAELRGKALPVRVVKPVFVRNGRSMIA